MSETCISLAGSTTCPAFASASISTDSTLVGFLYVHYASQQTAVPAADLSRSSFLQFVNDRASFDAQLASFVQTTWVQDKCVFCVKLDFLRVTLPLTCASGSKTSLGAITST